MINTQILIIILGSLICTTSLVLYSILRIRKINQNKLEVNIKNLILDQLKNLASQNTNQINILQNSISHNIQSLILSQNNALDRIYKQLGENHLINEKQLESMRDTMAKHLSKIQIDNAEKFEKMRSTVEEKLHDTLERRLNESFKTVSERLEMVHHGLGEMQNLALGVGDLKKVLSNVKTRGIWGEMQLGVILQQILTKSQYEENVIIDPNSQERVEYAIKIPVNDKYKSNILLPIDAKCPLDDYYRLINAQEACNPDEIELQVKIFERNIIKIAKTISNKYIVPPFSTDFAIMFLPIEGMYAEVLQKPALVQTLQNDFRVIVAGPTTISALLTSLQLGFRTLAIERHTSEVWRLFDTIRIEFGKFANILSKTKLKLEQAGKAISDAEIKTKIISNKLETIDHQKDENNPSLASTKVHNDIMISTEYTDQDDE